MNQTNNSISFFLPTRKGSERVPSKNTRPFAGVKGGLLEIKLKQLLGAQCCREIILSTDDPKSVEIAEGFNRPDKIKIVIRPDSLCLSTTLVQDLINYVPSVVASDHIFWLHVTTPFIGAKDYNLACVEYFKALNDGHDSLMSVSKLQQFLWSKEKGDVINFDRSEILWPNTQDLTPLYEINHAFYISSRSNYIEQKDRIGKNPMLYELTGDQKVDIDWGDDFDLAEVLYQLRHSDR